MKTCPDCNGCGKLRAAVIPDIIPTKWCDEVMPTEAVRSYRVERCPTCEGRGGISSGLKAMDETLENQMKRTITFDLGDGRMVDVPSDFIRMHGLKAVAEHFGVPVSDRYLPVIYHGRVVGSLPETWHPLEIKSKTYFYDPRPGDFVRDGDKWIAAQTLGPGDIEAVTDFVRL